MVTLTSCDFVNLVLNEEVDQRNQSTEESTRKILSVFDSLPVVRAQCQTTQCPRERRNNVGDHKYIVPIVSIGRRNICPSSAGQSSKQSC